MTNGLSQKVIQIYSFVDLNLFYRFFAQEIHS